MAELIELVSALRLEDGRPWGEASETWQREDTRAVLAPETPNLHFITRPRGASKTTDLAAIGIAWLLGATTAARGCAVAADVDQARLLIDAARGFLLRQPALTRGIKVERTRIIAKRTQASIDVVPADGASAYGLLGDFFIVDELAMWASTPNARAVWVAIISAVPKRPGARLVVLTSAGDPAHWSHRVLTQAKKSPRWRVHEVAGPCPWLDPEDLAEQRALLTPSQYARLHLNIWTAAEDRLVRPDDLAACVTLSGPLEPAPGIRYTIGVDLGLRHDRTAIAICHREAVLDRDRPATRVVLDRISTFQGTRAHEVQLSEIEELLVSTSRAYNGAKVFSDPWQAIGLQQRLRRLGVRVEETPFTAQSVPRMTSVLIRLLSDRLMALPDDEALIDELLNVRIRETRPGQARVDHDPDKHDDRVVAIGLAASSLVQDVAMPATATAARGAIGRALPGHRERVRGASVQIAGGRDQVLPRVAGLRRRR